MIHLNCVMTHTTTTSCQWNVLISEIYFIRPFHGENLQFKRTAWGVCSNRRVYVSHTLNENRIDIINASKSHTLTIWAIHWFDDAIYESVYYDLKIEFYRVRVSCFPCSILSNALCWIALTLALAISLSFCVLIHMLKHCKTNNGLFNVFSFVRVGFILFCVLLLLFFVPIIITCMICVLCTITKLRYRFNFDGLLMSP